MTSDSERPLATMSVSTQAVGLSDTDKAFKVRFISRDGEQVRDVLLAGSAVSPGLDPGVYRTYVQQIGGRSAPIAAFDLEVGQAPCQVPLVPGAVPPRAFAIKGAPARKSLVKRRQTRVKENAGEMPITAPRSADSAETPRRRSSFGFSAGDRGGSFGSIFKTAAEPVEALPAALETVEPQREFRIGASVDSNPYGSSQWSAATTTGLKVESRTDGTLVVHVDPSTFFQLETDAPAGSQPGEQKPVQRLRLTYALAGSPSVRIPVPLFRTGVDVEFRPEQTTAGLDVTVHIAPRSPQIAAMIDALDMLTGADAGKVLQWADSAADVLWGKYHDPWAAVVAALLLVRIGKIGDYRSWAYNLERIAATTADAAVAAAWAAATEDGSSDADLDSEVLHHLTEAARRGAPAMLVTYSLATELLGSLSSTAESADIRDAAANELKAWQARCRNRLLAHAFLMWEEADTEALSDVMAPDEYLELASGALSADGFSLWPQIRLSSAAPIESSSNSSASSA